MVVAFTQQLKKNNMAVDDMIELVINKKYEMSMSGMLNIDQCDHGQMDSSSLDSLSIELDINRYRLTEVNISSSVDIETGLLVYSVMMVCPDEETPLWLFLHNLISNDSPETLLLATVNTIMSEKLSKHIKTLAGEFYLDLQRFFNLELGRILLSLSSLSELDDMLIQDLPFFTPYMVDIQQCLNGHDCRGVRQIIKSLGE